VATVISRKSFPQGAAEMNIRNADSGSGVQVSTRCAMDQPRMRAAIYARVSTSGKGQSTINQVDELRAFCQTMGWPVVLEYEDFDSGGKPDRPQFQLMLQDAGVRRFDILVFWSLDRLTREGTLATLRYLELLENYGIRWRSLKERWLDSAGPLRDVIISLLASLAQQERVRISERIRAGMNRAMTGGTKTGRPIGRPRAVFSRDDVQNLRKLGLSWTQIAKKLGVSKSTARRACRPPSPQQ
jgi:DNA invertase Pin-like site-specific DNA recombinase